MGNGLKAIKVREVEYKKLSDYKIHPKQPYWEVIKKIIEEKEVKDGR